MLLQGRRDMHMSSAVHTFAALAKQQQRSGEQVQLLEAVSQHQLQPRQLVCQVSVLVLAVLRLLQ